MNPTIKPWMRVQQPRLLYSQNSRRVKIIHWLEKKPPMPNGQLRPNFMQILLCKCCNVDYATSLAVYSPCSVNPMGVRFWRILPCNGCPISIPHDWLGLLFPISRQQQSFFFFFKEPLNNIQINLNFFLFGKFKDNRIWPIYYGNYIYIVFGYLQMPIDHFIIAKLNGVKWIFAPSTVADYVSFVLFSLRFQF